jgi:serine/threonine protein kinase
MAFIEGQELKKIIQRDPLESSRALIIATQIAGGLEAAHRKGIVHRDIKSSNMQTIA